MRRRVREAACTAGPAAYAALGLGVCAAVRCCSSGRGELGMRGWSVQQAGRALWTGCRPSAGFEAGLPLSALLHMGNMSGPCVAG